MLNCTAINYNMQWFVMKGYSQLAVAGATQVAQWLVWA